MGSNNDGWTDKALFAVAGDPHSTLAELAVRPYQDKLNRDTQFSDSRTTIKIGAVLTASERTYLQEEVYPYLNLIFQSNVSSSHGLAYTRRLIEQELVVKKCIASERVCDIGGNWALNLRMGRVNIHSCCPSLDARDQQRQVTRENETKRWLCTVHEQYNVCKNISVDKKLARKYRNAKLFEEDPKSIFCSLPAEDCNYAADTVLFNDSFYDMNLDVIGNILDTKDARIGYGNITFSPEMLYANKGYIRGMNCSWERIKSKLLVEGKIVMREQLKYSFNNCYGLTYKHDYRNMILLATRQQVVTRAGRVYVIERSYSNGIMRLVLTRVFGTNYSSELSFNIWREEVRGKVLVRLYNYKGVSNSNRHNNITCTEALVDEDLYEGVLSYALRLDGDKFTEENIFSYCVSKNARMTINGVDVTVSKSESVKTAYKLAFTVWFQAFMIKYEKTMIHGHFYNKEMNNRGIRDASWPKILSMLLTNSISPGLYKKFYGPGGNVFENLAGNIKDNLAAVNESYDDLKNPDSMLPEPCISLTEHIDTLENDFIATEYPYDEFKKLSEEFDGKRGSDDIKTLLDKLSGKLRTGSIEPHTRELLTEEFRHLLLKLVNHDEVKQEDPNKPWSVRENVNRLMDNLIDPEELPKDLAKPMSTVDITVFGSDSVESFEGTEKVIEPEVSSALNERRTNHDDKCFITDRTEELKPSDSISNGNGLGVTILYNETLEIGYLIERFGVTFDLINVSGEGGLCAVIAVTKALEECGIITSEKDVYDSLVRASDGSRTSWFTLADIAVLCDSYSIGCVLLRNSLNEPLEEAKLRIDRYKFNASDKNIVIYHSNNHWQYIAKGITYRWMFDKETFNVKEKSPFNDFESPENHSEVDEEEDPLVAMGIDSEDLNCDVLGGGKCQKYVKFLRRKPEVFDPEKVQLLHENEEINYGSNEDNGNSDDTHKTVVDVHSPCEIFVKGLTKAFDSSSEFCSKIQSKVRNDNGYGAKLLKITSFDFKIHNKIVSEFRRSDEFRTKIFFGFIIAWMTLFAGLLHTITSFTLIGFCSQIIALIVIKILFQNFLIGFLIKTTRWFLSNMGTFGEYLALVTFVILVHLTYKCYKFSFMNSSKIHEKMSDESIVVAEENVTEARQDKTVNSVFGNKPYNTEYKNRKPYSASTVLNEVDEIRILQKEEYDKVEEVLEKTLLTRPVASKDKKPTKIQIAGESSSNYREEGEKAGYNTLSKTDRERTLIDRTALVKSYVDYLKTSVTNYLAHCDFVWSQRKKFGEKFFSAQYRRDKSTLHAHVLETTKPGVFKLPQLYTRDENHSITLAYVPGTNGKGKLCRAAVKDDNLIVDEDPVCVMIFFGMLEYLDFLTLNSLLNERNINSIEPTRKIKLIDGVPGCAKSTEIANSLREGEMVAVASRAANFELHEKLIARNKNPAASRTIGSRIIGRRETCDRLYVDEGLKVHPGELLVLAEICCCKELIIFGDSKQNRFKPRVPGYSMPENPMHWSVELRTESKTMTKDAVVAVGRLSPTGTGPNCDGEGYYPHGITTISKIEKSMNVIEISAQGEIPKVPNAKYLTFTQEDKHKLLNHGFKNANTIDEFQGGRSKHVILVRLSKNMDVNLRNSSEQFIVAVSRHTERLDYCTVEQPSTLQDLVYRSIMRVNAISNLNAAYGNFSGDKTAKGVITSEAIDFSLKGGGIAPGLTNSVPVTTINCCLEELIPGCTTTEMTYDNTMIELSNINVACEGSLRIPVDRIPAVLKPRKTLKSKIHSSMPPPRQTTFRQCLFSLIKRNMGGAYVGSPMDYRNFARNALESMFDTFAVENWRSIVSTWDKIVPNEEDMLAWERIQNPSTHSAMNRVDPNMAMTDVINHVDDYQFILKPMPKAATDVKPLKVYPTVQTVMYHDKTVNSFFGPIIRRADVRFRSILRTNILYNKGRSIDNIENFLDEHYVRSGGCITIENDFSDYDRSQKEVAHCLDEVLLEILGLTGEDIALWMRGHNVNTNYNFQLGLRVNLLYQRKSGDVTTAFGNTVLNMVALSYGLKLRRDEVFSAMFLGDDSWLQLKKSPSLRLRTLECSERIAVHFNGEAKTAIFKVGYFCGNYIIETDEKILLMADPVKRAVKLGRWDVKEASVLHENWISFKDLMRNYDNEAAQECLALAVLERTPKATFGTVKILIESLNSLSKSFKEFRNCYDKEVTVTHY